jgi:hypothetical protein
MQSLFDSAMPDFVEKIQDPESTLHYFFDISCQLNAGGYRPVAKRILNELVSSKVENVVFAFHYFTSHLASLSTILLNAVNNDVKSLLLEVLPDIPIRGQVGDGFGFLTKVLELLPTAIETHFRESAKLSHCSAAPLKRTAWREAAFKSNWVPQRLAIIQKARESASTTMALQSLNFSGLFDVFVLFIRDASDVQFGVSILTNKASQIAQGNSHCPSFFSLIRILYRSQWLDVDECTRIMKVCKAETQELVSEVAFSGLRSSVDVVSIDCAMRWIQDYRTCLPAIIRCLTAADVRTASTKFPKETMFLFLIDESPEVRKLSLEIPRSSGRCKPNSPRFIRKRQNSCILFHYYMLVQSRPALNVSDWSECRLSLSG